MSGITSLMQEKAVQDEDRVTTSMNDMLTSTNINLLPLPSRTLSPHTLLEAVRQTAEMLDPTSISTAAVRSLIRPCQTPLLTRAAKTLRHSLRPSPPLQDLAKLSTPTQTYNNLRLPVQPCLPRVKTSISFPKCHLTMLLQEDSSVVVSYL